MNSARLPNSSDWPALYFRFVADAALPEGGFHNRRGADESWADEIGSDDSQGRAIWSLGTAARSGTGEVDASVRH